MKACPSGKVRYRDKLAAKLALAAARRRDSSSRPKLEQRVYRCPECAGFHLTARRH